MNEDFQKISNKSNNFYNSDEINQNQLQENKVCLDREKKFKIFTKLKDFYSQKSTLINKNHIEEKIEPVYESMRIKYKNLYNNSEPTFFIRVPYTQIIFGDSITDLFEEQIITTLEKDLIICGGNNEKELQIEFFDKYCDRFKYNINNENKFSVDSENDLNKFVEND